MTGAQRNDGRRTQGVSSVAGNVAVQASAGDAGLAEYEALGEIRISGLCRGILRLGTGFGGFPGRRPAARLQPLSEPLSSFALLLLQRP